MLVLAGSTKSYQRKGRPKKAEAKDCFLVARVEEYERDWLLEMCKHTKQTQSEIIRDALAYLRTNSTYFTDAWIDDKR